MQPEVLLVGGNALRDRVAPADQLKLRRDLAIIQVGMVTAAEQTISNASV
jgi:hypothetical protein